jgi:glycosyltransferase involved in cell wall biosynthesis
VVTVISAYTGQRLREYTPSVETVTIPFGAAAAENSSVGSAKADRLATDPFELLFVGRLVRRKGVPVLLDAVNRMRDDSRLTLRIVGGGPEKAALEARAKELGLGSRVVFEGLVTAEAIQGFFARCDALVLPAIVTETGDTEGLGVVLIEAMGYGKPVIASAVGGILDVIPDDETGLRVPPGDVDALADAIQRAMNEPGDLRRIAKNGTRFAAKAFGWDE